MFPRGQGVREGEGIESGWCGGRGGGGSVAGFGTGLGRRGRRPEPCGVGRRWECELVRIGGCGGEGEEGADKGYEREVLVVWLKAGRVSSCSESNKRQTHRLISLTIASMCHPCSLRRHATTRVVCDIPSTSAM